MLAGVLFEAELPGVPELAGLFEAAVQAREGINGFGQAGLFGIEERGFCGRGQFAIGDLPAYVVKGHGFSKKDLSSCWNLRWKVSR